jgi:metal-dependent amidase/aminoacylase/carboxypeptidase family protein
MEKDHFGIGKADRIYGLHNLPGYPHGEILGRDGVFAYASEGLVIDLLGTPSHAAYPESGKNPAPVLADLVQFISAFSLTPADRDSGEGNRAGSWTDGPGGNLDPWRVGGLRCGAGRNHRRAGEYPSRRGFATIVGMTAGREAFGTAAADGRLMCTLRGEDAETVREMEEAITGLARRRAAQAGIKCSWKIVEPFPETRNDPDCVAAVRAAAAAAGLPVSDLAEPMRWSEDFGHYTANIPGAFFGLGAGTEQPQLHTSEYDFPDSLIPIGIRVFSAIAGGLLRLESIFAGNLNSDILLLMPTLL